MFAIKIVLLWSGRLETITSILQKRLLKEHQGNANTTDNRSRTPIVHAVEVASEEMIRTLLESAADIN